MNDSKKWWASKTLWFNAISGLLGIAATLQADSTLSPKTVQILGAIVTGGNIALRFLTDKPIGK